MPSIPTQYTPLESLLFLQSVAHNGTDSTTLSSISQSLKTNQFVQGDENYDPGRLTPEALKTLYEELLLSNESAALNAVNGTQAAGEVNPRKRKLSLSPDRQTGSEDVRVKTSRILDHLYARYRERVVAEIKHEEQQYETLVAEIKVLEDEAKNVQKAPDTAVLNGHVSGDGRPHSMRDRSLSPSKNEPPSASPTVPDGNSLKDATPEKDAVSSDESKGSQPLPGQMLPPPTPGLEGPVSRTPSIAADNQRQPAQGARSSPAPPGGPAGQVQLQQHSSSPGYGHAPQPLPLPSSNSPRPSDALPPISSIVAQPPPPKAVPSQRRSSGPVPPRKSPILPSPSPHYQQQPPYPYHYPPWPQYNSPNSPYANPQYYHQQSYPLHLPPAHSPVYHPYSPYTPPLPPNQYGPTPYTRAPPPGQSPQYAHYPWPGPPPSATPSVARPGDPSRLRASGSSTPWTPGGIRRGSPDRPLGRDVSPLSDRAVTPVEEKNLADETTIRKASPPKYNPRRGRGKILPRARASSSHSSALGTRSRSQSQVSVASEARQDRAADTTGGAREIKHETPSTPAPLTSDGEQRSSDRRRGRGKAVSAPFSEAGWNATKRKRESETETSQSPSLPTPRPGATRGKARSEALDPSLIPITKNLARVAAPLLNDINAHKHAGIFAKPLTERDAPGYKNMIYRPQDLKSIRAAVGRGSRAANAAIEEIETKMDEANSPASPAAKAPNAPTGSILVTKTEDLMPPRAIVNSAQLEMEFMRLFANAIMFNPLPPSERGLPPELDLQKDGPYRHDRDKERGGEDDGEQKGYAQEEEGGIIHDTREMFDSVEKAVTRWRSVEQGQGFFEEVSQSSAGLGNVIGLRGGSAGMSDAVAEESTQEEGEGMSTTRKRRRLLE